MRHACRRLETFTVDGRALVSSCEPCPMCLASALWARIDRIVYAADRDDAPRGGFDGRKFDDLFEKRPKSAWSMRVQRLAMPNRTVAWLVKEDRIDY